MTDVLFSVANQVGLITLNRPHAFNALNLSMIQAIYQQLLAWQRDDDVHLVVIQSVECKAFCAGGDVRWLYETGRTDLTLALSFFEQEYRLNQLIHDYPKPYIALMDGMTMGGGVGISLHGSHAIATEKFVFSMPETAIGFFPDIGASYLLKHCPDETGIYLGLTGQRLNAEESLELGLVKQVIHSSDIPLILEALIKADLGENTFEKVTNALAGWVKPVLNSSIQMHRPLIKQCFQHRSISDIMAALKNTGEDWGDETYHSLTKRSPLSLCVTLRQLRMVNESSLKECLSIDGMLVKHFMQGHDFYEGVRALLIDKDQKPDWQPKCLDDISYQLVDAYFTEHAKQFQ